ncbi:MAG: hypothetical protein ABSF57_01815 [Acidobacteriaceae bacterium]
MNRLIILFAVATVMVSTAVGQRRPDVVERLMPDGNAQAIVNLTPAQRDKVVIQLQAIQKQATGDRLLDVTFLLAAYGSDYEKNRDALIHNLRGCSTSSYASRAPYKYGCSNSVADCLIVLYKRGHKEVLQPLLLLGMAAANADIAEGTGGFGSDILIDHPTDLLDAIRPLQPKTQRQLCRFVGSADGGGIGTPSLRRVQKNLKAIGDDLALTCLQQVEAANKPQ